jgi:uncharacterized membrane protein HdeD (DUF308 family)
MPQPPSEPTDIAVLAKRLLWLLKLQGALLIGIGVVAMVYPLISAVAFAWILGWLLMCSGVAQAIGLLGEDKSSPFWVQLVSASVSLIVGYLFVSTPTLAVETVVVLMIVLLMVSGVTKVVLSLAMRPMRSWAWVLASGIVGVLLSIILIGNPGAALWMLGLMIGIQLIGEGFATLAMTRKA